MSPGRARRRILLTGFAPFGGEPVNPSERLVEAAPSLVLPSGWSAHAAVLPVDRQRYAEALAQAIALAEPELVVALGQATGRPDVQLESVAYNSLDFRGERDNAGHEAAGEPIVPGGPDRLHARLPVEELAEALTAQGLPVRSSFDAGRHLCNAVLFELLFRHGQRASVFMHVPLLPEQAERRARGEPSLPLETSKACLQALLVRLADRPMPSA